MIAGILALRLLSKIHREFERPLTVAYLDIKAAFDSVDCLTLWKALHNTGVPEVLLHLIVALHENIGAYVRLGKKLSSRFCTSSSVRQSCILAPDLFCVAIDWILDHVAAKPHFNIWRLADRSSLTLPTLMTRLFYSVRRTISRRVYIAFHRQLPPLV